MTLPEPLAREVAMNWAEGRRPVWSAAEVDAIGKRLVALAAATTPHVVPDAKADDDQLQEFLLDRTRAAIEGWLIRTAASVRRSLGDALPRYTPEGTLALGLRTATESELDRLQGVGAKRAKDLARSIQLAPVRTIADLDAVEGVGPGVLKNLELQAYLDHPRPVLMSASVLAFCQHPSVETYLSLLDSTDLELFYGDESTLRRRPLAGGAPSARFMLLLDFALSHAQRQVSPAAGVLASQVNRHVARQALTRRYQQSLANSVCTVVASGAYTDCMLEMIASARKNLRLVQFIVTASPHEGVAAAGSLAIVSALEKRAAEGIKIEAILDRDRPEDPYHSAVINRAVVTRLRAAGVSVCQDLPAVLLHSKFLIADESSVVVGSHNLTTSSITSTHEVSVRLDGGPIVQSFVRRFESLWTAFS